MQPPLEQLASLAREFGADLAWRYLGFIQHTESGESRQRRESASSKEAQAVNEATNLEASHENTDGVIECNEFPRIG